MMLGNVHKTQISCTSLAMQKDKRVHKQRDGWYRTRGCSYRSFLLPEGWQSPPISSTCMPLKVGKNDIQSYFSVTKQNIACDILVNILFLATYFHMSSLTVKSLQLSKVICSALLTSIQIFLTPQKYNYHIRFKKNCCLFPRISRSLVSKKKQ